MGSIDFYPAIKGTRADSSITPIDIKIVFHKPRGAQNNVVILGLNYAETKSFRAKAGLDSNRNGTMGNITILQIRTVDSRDGNRERKFFERNA